MMTLDRPVRAPATAPAVLSAGGDGARAEETAQHRGSRVDHEDGLDILDVAVLVNEVGAIGHTHNRTHSVEEIAHEKREDEHE